MLAGTHWLATDNSCVITMHNFGIIIRQANAYTFERPIDGADASVAAHTGVYDEHGACQVVLPQALQHTLSQEGGQYGVRTEGVVGGQHVVLTARNLQHYLKETNDQNRARKRTYAKSKQPQ